LNHLLHLLRHFPYYAYGNNGEKEDVENKEEQVKGEETFI
jgi:hypothetical protein